MTINRKKTVVIWMTIICTLFFILFWNFPFWISPKPSDIVIDKQQVSNSKFGLSVTVRGEENGGYVPGAYYTFEVFSPKSSDCREIFTFRHDDPIPIDKNSLKFVNEDIGFVYMGYMFAVTANAGDSWAVWDSRNHKYLKDEINYGLIKSVNIQEDGNGEMTLSVFPSKNACQILFTRDYGHSWDNGNLISECSF